jgi:hypothetical protein
MTLFSVLLGLALSSQAPQNLQDDIWKILLNVKYEYTKEAYIPKFDEKIKSFDNQSITIKGYMYALEEAPKHSFFMLSYYPVSMCFFCGGAGPESVIEVNAQKPLKYSNRQITLKGKLRLNSKDRERLFFILLDAELIE